VGLIKLFFCKWQKDSRKNAGLKNFKEGIASGWRKALQLSAIQFFHAIIAYLIKILLTMLSFFYRITINT